MLKYTAWLKKKHNVKSREVVALDFTNKPQFLFLVLALWSLGAVPALINSSVASDALVHCLRTAGPRIVIVDEDVAGVFTAEVRQQVASGKTSIESITFDTLAEEEARSYPGHREPDEARAGAGVNGGNRDAALMFTSGTTGMPKAAHVGYFKCHAAVSFVQRWGSVHHQDIYYTVSHLAPISHCSLTRPVQCMPMYHLTPLGMAFLPSLTIGCALALGRKFSTRTFWPTVRETKATVIQYVGETCRYLLAAPIQRDPTTGADLDKAHHVRLAYGNGLRPDVWSRFRDRFGIEAIAEFYSATEAPFATWNLSRNDWSKDCVGRYGSFLRLFSGRRMRIVETDWGAQTPKRFPTPDGTHAFCRCVGPGEAGEMLAVLDPAAVETTYQGYHGNAAASAARVLRDVFAPGDAWFRTGDALRQDADGRIFFADRLGDTFRWRAENVATAEVSEVLGAHPAVAEANVYGVALPHHDGRAGCAAVTFHGQREEGWREPSTELRSELAAHARDRLPRYAVPLFVRAVREIQATGTNKQQKHVLREQGVDPRHLGQEERMYWLRDGTYVPFREKDWEELQGGRVRL